MSRAKLVGESVAVATKEQRGPRAHPAEAPPFAPGSTGRDWRFYEIGLLVALAVLISTAIPWVTGTAVTRTESRTSRSVPESAVVSVHPDSHA